MVSCRHFESMIQPQWMISFLFDIFLGPSYNQSPPSVKYMTVRYPPHSLVVMLTIVRRQMVENFDSIPIFTQSVEIIVLYFYSLCLQDGKVCLSLLGTWQGPGWVPGKSTLLQVFLGILWYQTSTWNPYRCSFPSNPWSSATSRTWTSQPGPVARVHPNRKRVTIVLFPEVIDAWLLYLRFC